MSLLIRYLIILFLGILTSTQATATVEPLNRVVALVNNEVITQNEFDAKLNLAKKQIAHQPNTPNPSVLEKQILEQLIQEKLQLQRATLMGIQLPDTSVDSIIENIAKQNKMSLVELREAIAQEGLDFEEYKNNVKTQYLLSNVRQREITNLIEISKQEIDQFLNSPAEQQAFNQQSPAYQLGHLLIPLSETPSPEELKKAQAQAKILIQKLQSGSEAARTVPLENLGWRKKDELPTLFVSIVPSMKKNEVQGPIQSASGLHIIQLIDKQGEIDETAANPAAKRQQAQYILKNRKANEKLDAWLKQLRDEAYVQIYLDNNLENHATS